MLHRDCRLLKTNSSSRRTDWKSTPHFSGFIRRQRAQLLTCLYPEGRLRTHLDPILSQMTFMSNRQVLNHLDIKMFVTAKFYGWLVTSSIRDVKSWQKGTQLKGVTYILSLSLSLECLPLTISTNTRKVEPNETRGCADVTIRYVRCQWVHTRWQRHQNEIPERGHPQHECVINKRSQNGCRSDISDVSVSLSANSCNAMWSLVNGYKVDPTLSFVRK